MSGLARATHSIVVPAAQIATLYRAVASGQLALARRLAGALLSQADRDRWFLYGAEGYHDGDHTLYDSRVAVQDDSLEPGDELELVTWPDGDHRLQGWAVEDPDHEWHYVAAPDAESAERQAEREEIQVVRVVPWGEQRETVYCWACEQDVVASIGNETSIADHGLCDDCMECWRNGELQIADAPDSEAEGKEEAGERSAESTESADGVRAAHPPTAQLRHDAAAPWVTLWRRLGDDMPCPQCGQEQIKTQDRITLCLRCGWQAHNPAAL